MGTKIDDAIKQKVIEAHAKGVSNKEITEQLSISLSSVSRIIKSKAPSRDTKKITKAKKETDRQKKIADLEKRILQLEKKIYDLHPKRTARRNR